MSRTEIMLRLPGIFQTLFVFAVGASLGSLINVLVYRIPRGLSVVTPPSRCPSCDTKLTFRENIPILGWLLLRGRCRFCGVKISPEYPLVEAFVAGLFALVFVLYYLVPPHASWLGVAWGEVGPEWTRNGLLATWPAFTALLVLLASLVAMTLIDARTYTIPLVLCWVPTAAAAVLHTGHALWFGLDHGPLGEIRPGYWIAGDGARWYSAEGWLWTLTTPDPSNWGWIGAGIGGIVGVGVSLLLQRLGLIRRSFADYESWEQTALADQAARSSAVVGQPAPAGDGTEAGDTEDRKDGAGETDSAQMWIQYPHARREMFVEAAFVAPIIMLMIAGGWLARTGVATLAGPYTPRPDGGFGLVPPVDAPLWITVLGGVCLGYLIGGGVVWSVRLFGSVLFGKEAMGMGDVHLMAAVGACLGWADAVLGFFGAAFVGIAYAIAGVIAGGKFRRAMPFGPFLAVATVLVLLFKPAIEVGLARVFVAAGVIDLP